MSLISVIIPVFNAGRFLEECVESVLSQTFPDFDVCLVDDGSTDGSGNLCDSLAAQNEKVRVIHMDGNRGVSVARNRGIEETQGTWVCFVDGDDWVTSAYLKELAVAVEDGECDLAVAGLRSVRAGKKDEMAVPPPMELESCSGKEEDWVRLFRSFLLFGPVAKLYRRELLNRYSIRFPEDICYGEDLEFNMAYLKCAGRLRTVDRASYSYRRAERDTLSTRFIPEKFTWIVRQFRLVREYFRNSGLQGNLVEGYLAFRWWGLVYDSLFEIYHFKEKYGMWGRFRAIRTILKTPENRLMRSQADVFPWPGWMKICLFHRLPFCLFLLMEGVHAGNKTI